MATTRKQKKARKSSEQDMLSDIENFDTMLDGNCLDRKRSTSSHLAEGLKAQVMETS